jgi:hypothetical protein
MRHFPHRNTHWPSRGSSTSKKVNNPSGHNPRHLETTEESIPQSINHVTVKEKMIHGFPSLLTHITSVYHDNISLPEIVHGKDLAKSHGSH